MGDGCFVALGRLIAGICTRVGVMLATVLTRTVGFLLLYVIGPLCLGMTREVIRRMTAGWRGRESSEPSPLPRSRLVHALLGGVVWAGGYLILSSIVKLISTQLATAAPTLDRFAIGIVIIFVIGSVVGVLAFGYDEHFSGW
jgi:hypothetical protein